jgi:phospholipid/cholesterol/gamma-HCH transport system substrate-binding protein
MRETSRRQEITVGIVTIIAIAALVGGIIWGKGFGFSVNNRTLRFHFPNAAGIDVGAPVTLNGVRQGSVTAVSTDADGVLIEALVETKVPLRSDAAARIEMAELTGGKRIELLPGSTTRPLASDAIIEGTISGDATVLLAEAGAIATDARKLVLRLDTAVDAVNRMLADGAIQRRVDNTLINLEDASGAARSLVVENRARIDQTIASLNATMEDLRGLLLRTTPAAERTIRSAELAAGDARLAIAGAQGTLLRADTLVMRLDSLVYDVRYGRGTASMMLYDTAFAGELRRTIESTRAFIEQMKRNGVNINFSLGRRP